MPEAVKVTGPTSYVRDRMWRVSPGNLQPIDYRAPKRVLNRTLQDLEGSSEDLSGMIRVQTELPGRVGLQVKHSGRHLQSIATLETTIQLLEMQLHHQRPYLQL